MKEVEESEDGLVMCLECGEEFRPEDKYDGYKVGKVEKVDDCGSSKKGGGGAGKKVMVDIGDGNEIQVVTKAKYVEVGSIVVVACEGAIVPAGCKLDDDPDAVQVKTGSVYGTKSEGMLCDCPMLGWTGGAKGIVVKLDESYALGSRPPEERPRI